MFKITDEALKLHQNWLNNVDGGVRLSAPVGSNLSGSNLRGSNLSGSNLRGSNLSGSNLRGSNLRGSNLRGTTGNGREIITLQCGKYWVNYTHDRLQIGCKNYAIAEWWGFSDDAINSMDKGALEWWKIWKPILMQIISINPATPTGHEGA
jgi:hypothetical protein